MLLLRRGLLVSGVLAFVVASAFAFTADSDASRNVEFIRGTELIATDSAAPFIPLSLYRLVLGSLRLPGFLQGEVILTRRSFRDAASSSTTGEALRDCSVSRVRFTLHYGGFEQPMLGENVVVDSLHREPLDCVNLLAPEEGVETTTLFDWRLARATPAIYPFDRYTVDFSAEEDWFLSTPNGRVPRT